MNSFFTCVLVLFSMIVLWSCDEKNVPFDDHRESHVASFNIDSVQSIIRATTDSFTNAHITGDTAFLNRSFSSDARILPPDREVIKGQKAISELNSEWVSYDIHEFRETSTRFYGNKDFIVDEGIYSMKFGEDSIVDEGKYVNIWRYENGKWCIHCNIWNSNIPNHTGNKL